MTRPLAILAASLTCALALHAQTPANRPADAPTGPAMAAVDRVIAIAGDHPILWSEVLEEYNTRRAQGSLVIPTDSVLHRKLVEAIIDELVDAELLIQKAVVEKVEVADGDVLPDVETQLKKIREQFKSEQEFRTALAGAGFGTPEEYKKTLVEAAKRAQIQRKLIEKMKSDGKLVRAVVSEADVVSTYERTRNSLPKRPAQVTFRQIVISPTPSPQAKALARAKIDSLLLEVQRGGGSNFELVAKRESMDPSNKETGGDLGWNKRGRMVPEFDRMMFALPPGVISPVVETTFGFHIIRVDKVQPAEVKARHILIIPKLDSLDEQRARRLADSVATAWRAGSRYDTLSARFHDPDEVKAFNDPFPTQQLPPAYLEALKGLKVGEISPPFAIENQSRGTKKFVAFQLITSQDEGMYSVGEVRERIRAQLVEERSMRRFIDGLRASTFVQRNPIPELPAAAPAPTEPEK
ncbi:MAG: peptidylprolyl isomerase [Gemmatimonadaceae bacterium]|nr:peptidylprolyl isomerase [Gemmatimonadaceae bacterium]